jgi:hypothetical protein
VNAGQPNLKKLVNKQKLAEEKERIAKEEEAYKMGKALGRKEE